MHFQGRAHTSPQIKQQDSWKEDLKSFELFTTSPGDTRATHFPTITTIPSQHNTTRFAPHTKPETAHSFESSSLTDLSWNDVQSSCRTIRSNKPMQTRLPAGSQYPKKPPRLAVLASSLALLLVPPVLPGRQGSPGSLGSRVQGFASLRLFVRQCTQSTWQLLGEFSTKANKEWKLCIL